MTDAPHTPEGTPREGSLLDERILAPAPKRASWPSRARSRLSGVVVPLWRRPLVRRTLTGAIGVLLGLTALGVFLALRPVPKPDYVTGDMDDLFNYTLLTDEFNRLSVDERLELLTQLRERLGSMDADQSVLMAAFAARIQGELRDQLLENVGRLGVDMVDMYASDYDPNAPADDRRAFLMNSFVELHKRMDKLGGAEREMTDQERLREGFDQAQRDLETLDNADLSGEQAGEIFRFINSTMGANASPHEKVRSAIFMRDMARVLRSGGAPP